VTASAQTLARIPAAPDHTTLRKVFGAFPSGVTVLAAVHDSGPAGMAASSFTSVSLEPALVSVCLSAQSRTWPLLRRSARIGVSVLSEDLEHEQASRKLGSRSPDRFEGLRWRAGSDTALWLEGAAAWLECSIEREIEAGDHTIALLRVHDLGADPDVAPLVFHGSRYRRLAP
jgi:flavin reductase (DIM6/NTAB) family NADH-FMN oxidoreductase RutF